MSDPFSPPTTQLPPAEPSTSAAATTTESAVANNVEVEQSQSRAIKQMDFGLNLKIYDPSFRTAYLYPPYDPEPESKDPKPRIPRHETNLPPEKCTIEDAESTPMSLPHQQGQPFDIEQGTSNHSARPVEGRSAKKSSSRGKLFCIESYFYAEFVKNGSHDVSAFDTINNDGHKKSSGKKGRSRGRSKSVPQRISQDNSTDLSAAERPRLKPAAPIDCPKCFLAIDLVSLVKHIWEHLWDTLTGPAYKEDPSFNPCQHCCRNFDTEQQLKAHYLAINWTGKNLCMICIRAFETDQQLFDHMREHHLRHSMPMACRLCLYRSSTAYQFLQHYEQNHHLPLCPFCLEVFHSGDSMYLTNQHTTKERQADAHFLYQEIATHLRAHVVNLGNYQCDHCILTFTSSFEFLVHQKSAHSNFKLLQSKMPGDEFNLYRQKEFTIPNSVIDKIQYYDEATFKRMLGTLNAPVSVAIDSNLLTRFASLQIQNGQGTSSLVSDDTQSAIVPVDPHNMENLPKEFRDIKYDLNTAKRRTELESADSSLLDDTFTCCECLSPLVQRGPNPITNRLEHYSKMPLKCDQCNFCTVCFEAFAMHEDSHNKATVESNSEPIFFMTDWAMSRNAEEYLLTCYNCMSYFETYEQLARHIFVNKHIALAHSFEDEIPSGAIRITRFQVPEAVERGKSAVLVCDYSLDSGEELYSIKLYKNNVEFYRFVPGENPPIQSYKLNGIYVNLTESNSTHAVLTRTNLHSDGLYVCEISTEGPSFSTVRSEQLMKIYVLPNESVQIFGALEDQYNYGDNISLVCKSGKSWPPVRLHWFINDVLVDSKYTIYLKPENSSGLVATRLALNIYAKANDFLRGVLEIKCTATLSIVYEYESTEHLVTGSFKNKSNNRANWKREWSLQPNVKTPVIVGMKRNYLLNDILKLNCSTSIRNAKLKWFIMNREVNETHLVRYNGHHNGRIPEVLGLWLRMEKRLIQMPELRLHCRSYYSKQIAQFYSKLQIRTYDNQSWESQFASTGAATRPTSVPLSAPSLLFLVHLVLSVVGTIY